MKTLNRTKNQGIAFGLTVASVFFLISAEALATGKRPLLESSDNDSRPVTIMTKNGPEQRVPGNFRPLLQRSSTADFSEEGDTPSTESSLRETVRSAGKLSANVHSSTSGSPGSTCAANTGTKRPWVGQRIIDWIRGNNRKSSGGSQDVQSAGTMDADLGIPIISRKEWGAAAPGSHATLCKEGEDGYSHRQPRMGDQGPLGSLAGGRIEGVIHETQGSKNATPREIQEMQMCDKDRMIGKPPKHFNDVAYHFLIGDDGKIYQGVPLNKLGTHTGGANTGRIGIVFIGNNKKEQPSAAAQKSGDALVAALKLKYGPNFSVKGHHHTQVALGKKPGDCSDCMKSMASYIASLERRSSLIAAGRTPNEYQNMAFTILPGRAPEQLFATVNSRRSKFQARFFS